jgi:hypothetical protein
MNKRQILAVFAGILSLATGILAVKIFWFPLSAPEELPPDSPQPAESSPPPETLYLSDSGRQLSGPFTRKNLTFYLVHGGNSLKTKTPLTLEEAMDHKLVIVYETGDVNELSIENVSQTEEVFVQSGDIVKGGHQDRMLGVDLIVPAHSGRIPIDSFCVESERWTARGREPGTEFNSSTEYAPSKDIKLAAKRSRSQSEVWEDVADSQKKLSAATNSNAASSISRSSLPLTMQNGKVRSDADTYARFLEDIVPKNSDIIGIVMVINGKINSADTYGSSDLFVKLWPKLLKAASIEAVAESREATSQNAANVGDIDSFFEAAENAPVTENRTITDRIRMTSRDTKDALFLTTLDRGIVLHNNYLLK